MKISFGYAASSKKNEDISLQINKIKQYRPEIIEKNIFTDIRVSREIPKNGYLELKEAVKEAELALDYLCEGWFIEIIVADIDVFGEYSKKVLNDLKNWCKKGIIIRILNIPSTLMKVTEKNKQNILFANSVIFEYYEAIADKKYQIIREKAIEGMKNKKENGNWNDFGRPLAVSNEIFEDYYNKVLQGILKPFQAMREMNISTATYYRRKKELDSKCNNN